MESPVWMLVPWLVFAVAAGWKFWRITSLFRSRLAGAPDDTERVRASLERLWLREGHAP